MGNIFCDIFNQIVYGKNHDSEIYFVVDSIPNEPCITLRPYKPTIKEIIKRNWYRILGKKYEEASGKTLVTMTCNKPNRNGRVYDLKALNSIIMNAWNNIDKEPPKLINSERHGNLHE